jgi:tetratricopeptide (TPR) repeat protein
MAQNDRALELLERSLAILRPLDEPRVLVEAVTFLGIAMAFTGNYARSLELFGEGLEIAMQTGDRWFAALCLTEQISMPVLMGKSENSYERYQSVLADWRAIGDPRFTAFGLYFLSSSAVTLGKYAEARAALEESAALNLSVGDRWGLGSAYRGLGLVAQAQGEHAQALEEFQKSLDIFSELGASWEAARMLAEMGRSEFALGNDFEAERDWFESLRISLQAQAPLVGLEALVGLASLQAKRGNVERALEILSMVLEHPAGVQETKSRAAQLRAELSSQMSPQEIEAIQRRAGQKTFPSVAEDILRPAGNS